MSNEYTEYWKKVIDFIYGLTEVESDKNEIDFNYLFSEYKIPVTQQETLIKKLENEDVLEIQHKIPLGPMDKVRLTMGSDKTYESINCLGYEVLLKKDKFLEYRLTNPLFLNGNDESFYSAPHLSDDGEFLWLDSQKIELRKNKDKRNSSYVLAHLIFKSEDQMCTLSDFLTEIDFEGDGDTKKSTIKNALYQFNKLLGIDKAIRKDSNNFVYYGPGSTNTEKL